MKPISNKKWRHILRKIKKNNEGDKNINDRKCVNIDTLKIVVRDDNKTNFYYFQDYFCSSNLGLLAWCVQNRPKIKGIGDPVDYSNLPKGMTVQRWIYIQHQTTILEKGEAINVEMGCVVDDSCKELYCRSVFCGLNKYLVDWCFFFHWGEYYLD